MGSFSLTDDFDGSGRYNTYTCDISPPDILQSNDPSNYRDDISHFNDSANQDFLIKQRQDQQLAIKNQVDVEELKKQAERAKKLGEVEKLKKILKELQEKQINEPNRIERMKYTRKVLELEKQFAQAKNEYTQMLPSYRERIEWSLNQIVVPPLPKPYHYKQVLMWGFNSTPEEAERAVNEGIKNPFTDKPFDDVFAFGNKNKLLDFKRVFLDHYLSYLGELSPETSSRIGELNGATIDELVCHSNGYRIALVLIATGKIKVKKMRILGGDAVIWDIATLNQIAHEKDIQIDVNMIVGDVVPFTPPGTSIFSYMAKIGHPLKSFWDKKEDPTYQLLGLTDKPKYDAQSKVQVNLLSYPKTLDLNLKNRHIYDTYDTLIGNYSRGGYFTKEGDRKTESILQ